MLKWKTRAGINTRVDMGHVVFRGLEQVEDKFTCFLKLDGTIMESSLGSKGLMEELSVQTPPVAVWYHDRVERPAKTDVE